MLYSESKKIISVLLVIVMLFLASPFFLAIAESEEIPDIAIEFSITERNNVSVNNYLVKRGIPFKQGEFMQTDSFQLIQNGTSLNVPLQTKALELYGDGSIKWLLVSFVENLNPSETKSYILSKAASPASTPMTVTEETNYVTVENSVLSMTVNGFGISSLKYKGVEVFEGGVSLLTLTTDERMLNKGDIEIVENGEVYTTVKIKGSFAETDMKAEQVYTVLKDSEKIISEIRFSATNDTNINGLSQTAQLDSTFLNETHQATTKISAHDVPIYACGYMSAYSTSKNISFSMVSREPAVFAGTASQGVCNGFSFEEDINRMMFIPIHYNMSYSWIDGTTRSAYSEIILSTGEAGMFDNNLKTLENTPEIRFSENVYVRAGIIANDCVPAIAQAQIDTVKWLKDKRYGRIDAGSIPYRIDQKTNYVGGFDPRPGEVDYNFWNAYMMCADSELFDIVNESTQCWADINIYRGVSEWLTGANRYRNSFNANRTNYQTSQPYYGDNSGLYMGYLLTGNEWYKEGIKLTSDFYLLSGETYPSLGYAVPRSIVWSNNGTNIRPNEVVEIRYAMTARSLLQAYRIFRDERYLQTTKDIMEWMNLFQTPEGFWHQGVRDGWGVYDVASTSNYTMLYGLRGVCEYYNQTKNSLAKKMLINFADYLIDEMQSESGWMWDPIEDKSIWEYSPGDGQRGQAPFQEGMSTEIFNTVYNATGNAKYLDALFKMVRYYLASSYENGLINVRYCAPEYADGLISQITLGQASTMVRIGPAIKKTIEENIDIVRELGYEDMIDYFIYEAENVTSSIQSPYDRHEVTIHAVEKGNKRHIYIANHSGKNSVGITKDDEGNVLTTMADWAKDISLNVGSGGYLYKGMDNRIASEYATYAEANIGMYETDMASKIPVKVTAQSSEVYAKVIAYDSQQILFDVLANSGTVKLKAANGDFLIENGQRYNVLTTNSPDNNGYIRVKITPSKYCGTHVADSNNTISISLDFGSTVVLFADVEGHWAENDVASLLTCGVVEETSDNLFFPEKTIIMGDFAQMLTSALSIAEDSSALLSKLGYTTEKSKNLTREEMVDIAISFLEYKNGEIDLKKYGANILSLLVPQKFDVDSAAVEADRQKLTITNADKITGNIPLVKDGLYGSTVSWQSSDETVVSNDGVIMRPESNEENKHVTLTATITRGNESATRSFDVTVLNKSYVDFVSAAALAPATYPIKKSEGTLHVIFSAKTTQDNVDYVIGHVSSQSALKTFQDMPVIVRFGTNGFIDAYNDTAYDSEAAVPYVKDTEYVFEINANLKTCLYDVFVTSPDGEKHQIAKGYKFRGSAQDTSAIDAVVSVSSNGEGLGVMTKHSLSDPVKDTTPLAFDFSSEYTYGDVALSEKDSLGNTLSWYSLNLEIFDNSGKFLARPEKETNVKLLGLSSDRNMVTDINTVRNEYVESVIKAVLTNIIDTDSTTEFYPTNGATRAQAAAIVRRIKNVSEIN